MDMRIISGGEPAEELSPLTLSLLDGWQRGFPLVSRPYAEIGEALGLPEEDVIARLRELRRRRIISRIGAVVQPNTIGASTLAALAVPRERLLRVAGFISALPEVTHNYEREHAYNLWFVVTAADRAAVRATLATIAEETALPVLDVPMVRAFHIDLGFALPEETSGRLRKHMPHDAGAEPPQPFSTTAFDRDLLAAIEDGLPLVSRPYAAVARRIKASEDAVIARLAALQYAGIIRRFGIVVHHRRLGFRANAMVVWNIPDEVVGAAGEMLAKSPGVTLCYERMRRENWPYNLFCMIHGKKRDAVRAHIARLAEKLRAALNITPKHEILFSRRCFKQCGARFSVGARRGDA